MKSRTMCDEEGVFMITSIESVLLDLKARQKAGEPMRCPRCGADTMKEPVHTNALSRIADI